MSEPRVHDPRIQVPTRRVVALVAFVAVVLWLARPVLMPFALAAIIAYAFSPYIDAVQARTGRSRFLIVVILYGTGLAIVAALVIAFSGPVFREVQLLIRAGPDAAEFALRQLLGGDSVTIGDRTVTVEELAAQGQAALASFLETPEGAIKAAQTLLHGTLDTVLLLIVTFFLLLDGSKFGEIALRFLSPSDRIEVRRVAVRTHVVVGRWLRGQLVLVAFVTVITTIVFGPILHLPYPLGLGVLVGVLEVITFIGPLIAGAIVGIVALSTGGVPLAITAIVFLFILRQIEDVVIMPAVLGRAVNLHPLVALFAVVVASTAFGIVGTFLGVPVAAAINVALHEFYPAELGALPGDQPRAAVESAEPVVEAPAVASPAEADGGSAGAPG